MLKKIERMFKTCYIQYVVCNMPHSFLCLCGFILTEPNKLLPEFCYWSYSIMQLKFRNLR